MPRAGSARAATAVPTLLRLSRASRGRLGDGAWPSDERDATIMDLDEQHLALLRTAAERPDGLLHCPAKLVGAARRRMADR